MKQWKRRKNQSTRRAGVPSFALNSDEVSICKKQIIFQRIAGVLHSLQRLVCNFAASLLWAV
jgi:hypothetical protein